MVTVLLEYGLQKLGRKILATQHLLHVHRHVWPSCRLDCLSDQAGLPVSPRTDKDKVILAVEKLHNILQLLGAVWEIWLINKRAKSEWIFHAAKCFVTRFFAKIAIFLFSAKFHAYFSARRARQEKGCRHCVHQQGLHGKANFNNDPPPTSTTKTRQLQ